MKLDLFSLIGSLCCAVCLSASGQQVVTLTQMGIGTNSISIPADQSFTVKNVVNTWAAGGEPYLVVHKDGISVDLPASYFREASSGTLNSINTKYPTTCTFAGPAVLEARVTALEVHWIMATIEISPGPYPPDRSAVIGERDGPMKCTLEESTDLVNWTHSISGHTHTLTNANEKKFFRIKLERDVGE